MSCFGNEGTKKLFEEMHSDLAKNVTPTLFKYLQNIGMTTVYMILTMVVLTDLPYPSPISLRH